MKSLRVARAYTLVEVVVVVTLLGVLIGMAVPSVAAISAYTKKTQVESLASTFAADARRYAAYTGLSGNPQQNIYVQQAATDIETVDPQVTLSGLTEETMLPAGATLGSAGSYRLVQLDRDGVSACVSLPPSFTMAPIVGSGPCES